MKRPRVLLADDHRMFAECLRGLLEPEFDLIDIVEDGRALVESARRLQPDVIVADITMPVLNGLEALQQLRQDGANARVVFLTMQRDISYAQRAMRGGAVGYVLKHSASEELLAAVRNAMAGKTYVTPALAEQLSELAMAEEASSRKPPPPLTPRQREVLQLFAEGHSAREVASRLGISSEMADNHKARIMTLLGVKTVAELKNFAVGTANWDEQSPHTVFVVDADPSSLSSIDSILRKTGLPVRSFRSAEDFLGSVPSGKPGCLILALAMPGLDGLTLVERLAERGPLMPTIVVAGMADVASCTRAFRLGVFDLLEKPLDEQLLCETVHRALAQSVGGPQRTPSTEDRETLARLTPREKEILDHLLAGKTLKQVAALCRFSVQTAWKHQQKIFGKFRVQNEMELARRLLAGGTNLGG